MELTNKQLRQTKNLAKEIERVLVEYKETLKTMQFNEAIKKVTELVYFNVKVEGQFIVFDKVNSKIKLEEVNNYPVINLEEIYIDDEKFPYWRINYILNDLTLKQQEDFFINELDVRALENLLQDKLNIPVTLTKTVELAEESSRGIPTLCITSQNLKDQCGILGQSFKTIILSTFGKAYFYISEEDGKQHLLMPDLSFQYEFNNGGLNGHKAFKLNYDMENKEWSIE